MKFSKKNYSLLIGGIAFLLLIIVAVFVRESKHAPLPIRSVPVEVEHHLVQQGEKLPPTTLTTLDNKTINLVNFRGHKVVLNFWASWCTPCIVELPELLDLARKHDDIIFVFLSSDLTQEAVSRFLKTLSHPSLQQKNVIIAWDEHGSITRNVFGTYQLPETAIIDEEGRLVHKIIGVIDWGDSDILRVMDMTR